ncbi:hypothetical protein, partial [Shewanella sp. 10N.286.55.A9]|uniref:hypothetical protein n=1 Tax=Shewanella sp. 10N.286.55.A9 TaxID=3229720 RepID=UPI00354E6E3C
SGKGYRKGKCCCFPFVWCGRSATTLIYFKLPNLTQCHRKDKNKKSEPPMKLAFDFKKANTLTFG